MMRVVIPSDELFEYEKCRSMYYDFQAVVRDSSTFEEVLQTSFFYSIYDDEKLSLCVYYYLDLENRLWVNGYGIRHNHIFNKGAFIASLGWFNCDIYAECYEKPAIFGLLRCGFRRYSDGIYIYQEKEKGENNGRIKENVNKENYLRQDDYIESLCCIDD